jgi:hypothetical protein
MPAVKGRIIKDFRFEELEGYSVFIDLPKGFSEGAGLPTQLKPLLRSPMHSSRCDRHNEGTTAAPIFA